MEINTCLWNTWKEDNVNTKIQSNKKPDLPEDFQFTISEIFCTVWDEHAINLTEFFIPKWRTANLKETQMLSIYDLKKQSQLDLM